MKNAFIVYLENLRRREEKKRKEQTREKAQRSEKVASLKEEVGG